MAFTLCYIEIEAHIWCLEKSQKLIFCLPLFSAEVLRGKCFSQRRVVWNTVKVNYISVCLVRKINMLVGESRLCEITRKMAFILMAWTNGFILSYWLWSISAVSCELPYYTQVFVYTGIFNEPSQQHSTGIKVYFTGWGRRMMNSKLDCSDSLDLHVLTFCEDLAHLYPILTFPEEWGKTLL